MGKQERFLPRLQVIEENILLFQHFPQTRRQALARSKEWLANEWVQEMSLEPLPSYDDRLAPYLEISGAANNTAAAFHQKKRQGRCCMDSSFCQCGTCAASRVLVGSVPSHGNYHGRLQWLHKPGAFNFAASALPGKCQAESDCRCIIDATGSRIG